MLKLNHETSMEIIKSWQTPYSGCDPSKLRKKHYKIIKLEDETMAFCKEDSIPEYTTHEATILIALKNLNSVPSLIFLTKSIICTTYIKGKLLSEVAKDLGFGAAVRIGYQIPIIVAGIHRRGVVHSDIRTWNFIYGDNSFLYLIDFEYAYLLHKEPKASIILQRHHGAHLKPLICDWIDACECIADVWQMSKHWAVSSILKYVALSLHWFLSQILRAKYHLDAVVNP